MRNTKRIPQVTPETAAERNTLRKDLIDPKYRQRRELDKRRKQEKHKKISWGDE